MLAGRYRISEPVARGGFSIVYEASDLSTGQKVAIKECTITTEAEYFLNEAKLLEEFSGEESIVSVVDCFEEDNIAYIVMEYLEGCTLRSEIMQNGRWSAKDAVIRMDPLMRALEHMHQQNVVHRDISPDNIMVLSDGSLRLLDFGAAKQFEGNTKSRLVVKASYSPPEMMDVKGDLGRWSDVYSVCAAIYFCITGIDPEDAISRLVFDQIKDPSELEADILPIAEKILMRGMSLDKSRIRSMEQLRIELEKAYHILSTKERRTLKRKRRWRKTLEYTPFIIALVVLVGFVVWPRYNVLDMSPRVHAYEDAVKYARSIGYASVVSEEYADETIDGHIYRTWPAVINAKKCKVASVPEECYATSVLPSLTGVFHKDFYRLDDNYDYTVISEILKDYPELGEVTSSEFNDDVTSEVHLNSATEDELDALIRSYNEVISKTKIVANKSYVAEIFVGDERFTLMPIFFDEEESDDTGVEPDETEVGYAAHFKYRIGEEYVLTADMKVREAPSVDARWKKSSELKSEDKEKAVSGDEAVLAKGSTVKCLETRDGWMRIESGWICCVDPDTHQIYIRHKLSQESIEKRLNDMSDKLGGNTCIGLEGKYTFASEVVVGFEYVNLFADGTCALKNIESAFPETDEQGYSDGCYLVKDDRLYLNWGGSVTIHGYRMFGKELCDPTDEIQIID